MAQQVSYKISLPVSQVAGATSDWLPCSGYKKIRVQDILIAGAGAAGNQDIYATFADKNGKPVEAAERVINLDAGSGMGDFWGSGVAPLCADFIRIKATAYLFGSPTGTALSVITLQD